MIIILRETRTAVREWACWTISHCLHQVCDFLWIFMFIPPMKLTSQYHKNMGI